MYSILKSCYVAHLGLCALTALLVAVQSTSATDKLTFHFDDTPLAYDYWFPIVEITATCNGVNILAGKKPTAENSWFQYPAKQTDNDLTMGLFTDGFIKSCENYLNYSPCYCAPENVDFQNPDQNPDNPVLPEDCSGLLTGSSQSHKNCEKRNPTLEFELDLLCLTDLIVTVYQKDEGIFYSEGWTASIGQVTKTPSGKTMVDQDDSRITCNNVASFGYASVTFAPVTMSYNWVKLQAECDTSCGRAQYSVDDEYICVACDGTTGYSVLECGTQPSPGQSNCGATNSCSGLDFDITGDGNLNVLDAILLVQEILTY